MAPGRAARARSGSSIVELMVAIVILGIAASGIAAMTFQSGRTSADAETASLRDAALRTAVDRLNVQPFEELADLAGCDDRDGEHFAYLLCVRVEEEAENLKAVTVVVEPEVESVASASAVLLRSRTAPQTPF